jgi:hypothetical protein
MLTAPPLVSIDVVGPVGASDEMILPTFPADKKDAEQPHDAVWTPLIIAAMNCASNCSKTLAGYANYDIYSKTPSLSEQVFVDAWNATIDTYEQVFANSNLTLILVADAGTGLPAAASTSGSPLYLKATDVGGMTASSNIKSSANPRDTISVIGVKILTSPQLLQTPAPFLPLLGGAEFDYSVSSGPMTQQRETGCVAGQSSPPCKSPEERAFNVLDALFNCTRIGAGLTSDTTFNTICLPTSAPLTNSSPSSTIQFVHVDYHDVEYAEGLQSQQHPCPASPFPVPVNSGEKHKMCWSMQDLLSQANYNLFEMAGQSLSRPPTFTCQHRPTDNSGTPQ